MDLNHWGQIAQNEWLNLIHRFPAIELGSFVVMPNHIHFVVILHDEIVNPVGAPLAGAPDIEGRGQALPLRPKLGDIVGTYKSLVAMNILKLFKLHDEIMGPIWQRNYYEHIIRSNDDFKRIDAYIGSNPMNWADDELLAG